MEWDETIEVGEFELEAEEVVDLLGPRLTERRRARIAEVVAERTDEIVTVLDGIYDRGNTSAVIRTAEALGYLSMHVVESQEHFKEANRVTQGTDKWVDIRRWEAPEPCIDRLREEGRRLYVTALEADKTFDEVEVATPAAVVFGNEKDGVSPAMREAADETFRVEMPGFAQSFNISVGAALVLYELYKRRRDAGGHGTLDERQRRILTARYMVKSVDEPERLVRGLLNRRERDED